MKKKQLLLAIILLSLPLFIFSQKHDNIWVLGGNESSSLDYGGSIINFDSKSITPQVLATKFRTATTSFCDNERNLLFYSNGIKIINANHELMENGDSMVTESYLLDNYYNLGVPSYQSIIPLYFNNDSNKIIIIHQGLYPNIPGYIMHLYYSEIEINQTNNILGKVVNKHEPIFGNLYLDMTTATKHANGRDWWIITPYVYESKYHTILLTPDGFTNEFIQEVGEKPDSSIQVDGGGKNTFSPNGEIYVDDDGWNGIRIFDFDRCTGELTHRINIFSPDEIPHGVSAEISANSRFLYISNQDHIAQFDLMANDIAASIDTVAAYDDSFLMLPAFAAGFGSVQRGPDGKIYYTAGGFNYLHVIHQPNLQGDACEVEQFGMELPYYNATALPYFPNYRLGPIDGSPCDTLGLDNHPLAGFNCFIRDSTLGMVDFADNSFYEPDTWSWTFGDGGTSSELNPQHTYTEYGIYEVCLVVSNVYGSDTLCKVVELGTTGVEEVLEKKTTYLRIVPNPTTGEFKVEFNKVEKMQDLKLTVYNGLGQKVFEKELGRNFNHQIYLKDIDAGLYFCEFSSNGEILQTEKLMLVTP